MAWEHFQLQVPTVPLASFPDFAPERMRGCPGIYVFWRRDNQLAAVVGSSATDASYAASCVGVGLCHAAPTMGLVYKYAGLNLRLLDRCAFLAVSEGHEVTKRRVNVLNKQLNPTSVSARACGGRNERGSTAALHALGFIDPWDFNLAEDRCA